ncbi:MAG TPA: response regulator, partial [Rhodospirillales bacterium]|nr:response regulator [Rhodospirillales bacterium]
MRLLVVEDDPRIARRLLAVLQQAGYAVDGVDNGEDAWFRGDTEDYDAVVLDLGLPRMDGLTVLKKWREAGRDVPVLILTAR